MKDIRNDFLKMKKHKISIPGMGISIAVLLTIIITACSEKRTHDYPVKPVPFTSVILTDGFWAPRIRKNSEVTIPIAFSYCETTGRIKNFEIAGGLDTGRFQTIYPFDDSDVYKIIEGAACSFQSFPDPGLDVFLDKLIEKIAKAQEDDGYLYTNRTIAEKHGGKGLHEWAHKNRWILDSVQSHELYNLGHLYEAAVAHYQATGKKRLLDIATRSADLIAKDFGYNKCMVYPGHQGIEMGLVKLYRVTGKRKYLDLARFSLDIRGPNGAQYNQSHIRPVDQTEAAGHSVRATYMYSGMADIAALVNDTSMLKAITRIWEDLVYRKMYITGGIGAAGDNEGFAEPYYLPNLTAYCETCASVGDIFYNHRLFLLHGQSKYYDIIEKTLYNSMLSGVSLRGERFFYPNPLESDGRHERKPWFGCACCPSNIARFFPSLPGYVYATGNNELYVNLYISGYARIVTGRDTVIISQETRYPWDGAVDLNITPLKESNFSLMLRIPGWASGEAIPGNLYKFRESDILPVKITVNGKEQKPEIKDGYASVNRTWKPEDVVRLEFPMSVKTITADSRVKEDAGKVAVQYGPVIYCAEWPDNNTGNILNLVLDKDSELSCEFRPDLLTGVNIIKGKAFQTFIKDDGNVTKGRAEPLTLIPYAYWNNRGRGQMMVWIPVADSAARPLRLKK